MFALEGVRKARVGRNLGPGAWELHDESGGWKTFRRCPLRPVSTGMTEARVPSAAGMERRLQKLRSGFVFLQPQPSRSAPEAKKSTGPFRSPRGSHEQT